MVSTQDSAKKAAAEALSGLIVPEAGTPLTARRSCRREACARAGSQRQSHRNHAEITPFRRDRRLPCAPTLLRRGLHATEMKNGNLEPWIGRDGGRRRIRRR